MQVINIQRVAMQGTVESGKWEGSGKRKVESGKVRSEM